MLRTLHTKFARSLVCTSIFAALFLLAETATAQTRPSVGNLIVEQVGDGSAALGSGGTPIFLKEYTIAGTIVQTVTVTNTVTATAIVESGTGSSDGYCNRSANGKFISIPGYNAAAGTAGITGATSATVNRAVGKLDASGAYSFVAKDANFYNVNNFRSVVSDGTIYHWTGGTATATSGGGNNLFVDGGSDVKGIQTATQTNTRNVGIFNGQLYYSTGSAPVGIYAVGSGLPITAGQTATQVFSITGTSPSSYGFAFNTGGTICYVADDGNVSTAVGGLQKWVFSAGSWSMVYRYSALDGTFGARGLTVDWSGTNPVIYVTTTETNANKIMMVVDGGSVGTSTVTTVATASTNTVFRGITLAPFTATISGNASVCSGSNSPIIFSGNPNAICTYSVSSSVGTSTVSIGATGASTVTATSVTSPVTYTLVSVTDGNVVQTIGASVTVGLNPTPSPTLSPATASINTGASQILTFGGAVGDIITYTWTGGGPATTTIGAGGTSTVSVTPVTAGSYTYAVTSAVSALGCNNPSVTGVTSILTVTDAPFANISGSTTICDGSSTTLTFTGTPNATVTYDDGTTSGLTILLDATGTATLSVTPLVGTTVYDLTSVTPSGGSETPVSGSATVVVNPLPSSITGTLTLCVGATTALSDASSGTWSTSGSVATVGSASGVVSGSSAGIATIVFTSGGCTTSADVTVNPAPSVSSISGASSVCVSSVITLSDATGSGVWSSSSSHASVDVSGNVTGSTAGTATISYTVTNGFGCPASATQIVTVNPTANAGTINGVATITGTGSIALTDVTASSGGTWSSTNTGVATVGSTTGVVTGVIPGTTTIAYTVVGCGTAVATVNITVVAPPLVPFTVGNIVVEQLGKTDGSQPLSSTSGNSVFAVEYNGTTNTLVQAVAVTDNGTNGLIETGTGTSDGQMNRSMNGKFLSITGYNVALGGSTSVTTVAGAARGVGDVDGLGLYHFVTKDVNFYPGNNIRSAVSDGNTYYWTGGTPGGNNLFIDGGVDVVSVQSVTTSNTRTVGIYNNQLYYSTGSGTIGIYSLSGGLPTTTGQTGTLVIADGGTSPSPYGFSFNPGATICYLADDRSTASGGGVQKWVGSAGSYTLAYTYTATDGTNGCRGLTVDWSGAHPVVYITTSETSANKIIKIVDGGSVGTSTVTTVATAPTNTIFRGIALAPFTAKVDGSASLCGSGSSVITFTGSPGASITYSVNGTPASPVTIDASGVYTVSTGTITSSATYALGSVTDGTIVQTIGTSVTVTVNPIPAPTLSPATATIPTGFAQVLTFGGNIGDVITYTWTGGGSATTTIGASGTATVSVTPPGIGSYTYSVTSAVSAVGCSNPSVSGVTSVLSVIDIPFATISGGTNICNGSSTTLTFNGTNNSTVTYGDGTTPGLTIGLDGTGTATLTVTPPIGVTTYTLTSVTPPSAAPYTVTGSTAVTVNPIPSAIGGTLTVCVGSTTTLTDGFSGTWSSLSTSVATIGSTTGILTGVSAGTATIVFTSDAGCTTTAVATVNAVPAVSAISGASSVCVGSSTLLTDATGSGVWSATSPNASVDASGNVTGTAVGTATISYTVTNGFGCSTTVTMNISAVVIPTVNAITGTLFIYTSGGTNLTDATTGGTWSSVTPGVATIGTNGHVTSVSVGTTTISYSLSNVCGTVAATAVVTVNAAPSAFTRGNLVLVRTGDGLSALSSTSTSIALVEYTTGGVATGLTVPMPTSGAYSVSTSGSATSEGMLSLSAEKDRLLVAAYNAPMGTASIAGTTSAAVPRELMAIYPGATYSLVASTNTLISGNNPRGGTASGNNYYIAGASSGLVVFAGTVAPTQISSGLSNTRFPQVINGQMYLTSSSGSFTNVSKVGTGIPTTTSTLTTLNVITATTGTSPYGFSFSPDNTVLFVADDVKGISKYTASAGVYTLLYTFPTSTASRGMVVDYSGSSPVIYANNITNSLISFTDPGTAGGAASVGVATLATAPTNTAFRGLMFAPSCYAGVTTLSVPFCAGGNGQVVFTGNPTGVVSYNVDGGSTATTTLSATGSSTVTLTSLGASSTVNLININTIGCSSVTVTGSTVVTVNSLPSVGTTGGGDICTGATATLSGTGAVSYSWTGGITDGGAFTPGLGVNSYTVTGTDGNGCSNTAVATVTVNALPTVGSTGSGSVCSGSMATLSGTGAVSYGWTGGISNGVAFTPAPGVTTYTVTGTDAHSCSNTATASITVNALPTVGSTGGGVAICIGSTITLSGTGASSYSWTGGVTDGSAFAPTAGVHNYTVTGTDGNGCSNTATTAVTVNTTPTGTITGPSAVTIGSNIALTDALGGGTWSASNGNATVVGGVVHGVSAGTVTISYNVTGTCGAASATKLVTVGTGTVSVAAITGYFYYVCAGSTTPFFDATPGGAWSIAAGDAAIASISATGVVTGLSAGTATISYTVGVSAATKVVTVYPVPAAISGTAGVCQLSTTALSDVTPGGVWSSGIPGTATVGTSGIVSGVNPGMAPIYYTLVAPAGCRATLMVTVHPNPSAITGPVRVCSGSSITLSDATSGGAWSSLSTNVTVGGSGSVTGGTAGTAVITYALATGCAKTYNVTVNAAPAAISGNMLVCQGSTTFLTDATTGGVSWTSGNTAVATVSFSGAVMGVSTGTAGITYALTATGCSATTVVTVTTVPASITNNSPICMPSTITLSDATGGGTWTSNNTSVGTVDATSGVVTGIANGNATITYSIAGAGCYATTVVTVNNGANAGSISGAGTVCAGSTVTLSNTVTGGVWSSTNPAAGTISTFGVVNGIAAGTTTISYTVNNTCGTAAATTVVTVNPLPTAGTITGVGSVCAGSVIALTDATTGGVWSSSNAHATVDVSGNVSGVTGGTATISYTVTNGCGSVSATAVVTVNAFTAGTIMGAASVTAGLTITLSDAVTGGVWSASNSNATVSGVGLVTGMTAGTVTISYTITNTCGSTSATDVITVNASSVTGITGTLSVCAGSTTALTDATTGGTWHSSNTTVATVGTSGIVTGMSAGTATISYTVGGVPTMAVVTVNAMPSNIGGATSVCNGSSITMSDFTTGGAWTSSAGVSVTTGTTVTTVTGLTDGANAVTYTLGTGCFKTFAVTVKPLPSAILGNLNVCGVGAVTFLSDATAGTSWTISPVGTATISPSGRVYGVSIGTATVTYNASNGCITTATATVNALVTVAPISGATNVGHGLTITLSDATASGVWSSSNAALGSVDAVGNVTGVGTSGTVNISYSLAYAGGGCNAYAIKPISVHTPAPHAQGTTVAGMISVNIGVAVSLDEEATAGIWSSSNTDVVTVDGGVVTGIAPGAANITHTVTNSNGEVSTSVTPVVVSAMAIDIRVVPNPNNGAFTVKGLMGTTQDVGVALEVTDVLGQVIYSDKVTATGGKINEAISLNSSLANGMYMLNVHTATEQKVFHFVIGK